MRCTWIYAIWSRGSLTEKIRNNYAGERISDTRDEYAAAELQRGRPTLAMASKMGLLPIPTANDAKSVTLPASLGIRKGGLPKKAMQSDEYRTGTGSRLNPLYVAEMMGFPVNWLVSPFLGGAGKPSKPAETP